MTARPRLVFTWIALLLLLAASAATSQLQLGVGNLLLSLGIAALKTALVAWVFMQLQSATPQVRAAAACGLLFALLLGLLSLVDFVPRRHDPAPYQAPQRVQPLVQARHHGG